MPHFLGYFEYEKTEKGKENSTTFLNCKLLKDIGELPKGRVVNAITINIEFLVWDNDEGLIEDISVYH